MKKLISNMRKVLKRPRRQREALAKQIEDTMDAPLAMLGVVFILLLIAENFSEPTGGVDLAFAVATYVFAAVFVSEFVLRMIISPLNPAQFLRKYWWEVPLIVLPFFRFARVLSRLRIAHAAGVASSASRMSRGAGGAFAARATWLVAITIVVILGASELIFSYARGGRGYDVVLHDVALASVAGEPLNYGTALPEGLEILLGMFQVVIFASFAGIFGAFFLSEGRRTATRSKRS